MIFRVVPVYPVPATGCVTIYYWDTKSRPQIGHVALRIQTPDQEDCYISFAPQNPVHLSPEHDCCGMRELFGTLGEFLDERELTRYPDFQKTVLYGLDVEAMREKAVALRRRIEESNQQALDDPEFSDQDD